MHANWAIHVALQLFILLKDFEADIAGEVNLRSTGSHIVNSVYLETFILRFWFLIFLELEDTYMYLSLN